MTSAAVRGILRVSFLSLFLFFFLAPFLGAAAASPRPSEAASSKEGEFAYVIGPQNVVQIKIFGEAGVNQIYRVDETGSITHALVGRVKLGGLTVSQAENFMEEKLRGDYLLNPHVTIFIIEHSHFSVLGEVRKPGTFEILGRVSIVEAISMAGGFTPVASQRDVKIVHKGEGGESTTNVDMTRIANSGDNSTQIYLQADDVVVVSKSFF